MNARRWLTITVLTVILNLGCASPGTVTRPTALPQVKPQESKSNLDQQLALWGGQTAPKNSQDYQLGSEDLLDIRVYGQEDLSKVARVNGKGEITMPLLGPVKVAELTPQQLERRLEELYGSRYLKNPQVSVFVKEYRHQQVVLPHPGNPPEISIRRLYYLCVGRMSNWRQCGTAASAVHTPIIDKKLPGFQRGEHTCRLSA